MIDSRADRFMDWLMEYFMGWPFVLYNKFAPCRVYKLFFFPWMLFVLPVWVPTILLSLFPLLFGLGWVCMEESYNARCK